MKSYSNRNRSVSPKPIKKYASGINSQRKKYLTEWIKFLIPRMGNLVEENIKTGSIPYRLIQVFYSSFNLRGFQANPNQSQAYNNMLLINNYLFQEFPNSELPSPSEILKKGSSDCWILINTIFKNFQLNEIKKNWEKCLEWYRSILKLYGIEVSKTSFIKDCLNGVYFACILNCYTGFKLINIYKQPSLIEIPKNLLVVFESLKDKVIQFSAPEDFSKNLDEDFSILTIFLIFKYYRYEVPTLPTYEKIQFKGKPQLYLNTTDSIISLSSMESLEYSKSTIISKESSEQNLAAHTTPKWKMNKMQDIITDDSTGYSMQPCETSYDIVSVANTSYTLKTSDRLTRLEKEISECEKKCMFIADLRGKKERLVEVPSLKKLRIQDKNVSSDYICFLITPRLLKMIKTTVDNFIFSVVLDAESFTTKHEAYWLEWKDFSLVSKGKINVNEICSCDYNGRLLQIRTYNEEIVLQCLDDNEAILYADNLNRLAKPKTLFSRDISCNELILNIH